jgi:hypothetical protein
MKNAFEHHGVMNLSPSTINNWITQPALTLLKIAGITDGGAGPAAWRGQGADRAAAKAALDPTINDDNLIDLAFKVFDEYHASSIDDHPAAKIDKERNALKSYVTNAAEFYRGLGEKPEAEQGKVIVRLKDIDVPWVGYYDLLYADKVRDTKTVGRMVSTVTAAHCRQAALYAHATKREPWIDYVGVKEVRAFRVQKPDAWLNQLYYAAKSLERVLSFSEDIFECCRCVYPDTDHWMWGQTTKEAAKDIWKMEIM